MDKEQREINKPIKKAFNEFTNSTAIDWPESHIEFANYVVKDKDSLSAPVHFMAGWIARDEEVHKLFYENEDLKDKIDELEAEKEDWIIANIKLRNCNNCGRERKSDVCRKADTCKRSFVVVSIIEEDKWIPKIDNPLDRE